jgi:hypothetical protein
MAARNCLKPDHVSGCACPKCRRFRTSIERARAADLHIAAVQGVPQRLEHSVGAVLAQIEDLTPAEAKAVLLTCLAGLGL